MAIKPERKNLMKTFASIRETSPSITSLLCEAMISPKKYENKISSQPAESIQSFEIDEVEAECILSSILNAVALALGKEKDENARKYLAFHDNEGGFICAFYIEKDTTTESWELGAVFDDIEKVPEKDVIRHTDPSKFFGDPTLPYARCGAMRGVWISVPEYENQVIITFLLVLKDFMESEATEEGCEFKCIAEIPANMMSPALRELNSETLEAQAATASLKEDCGTFISKIGKSGIVITWEAGEAEKPYIKDDEAINVIIDSMGSVNF